VKLTLWLTKHHAWLTSALVAGEWSASRSDSFTLGVKYPRNPLHRKLGGLQSRSERSGDEENPIILRSSSP